MIVLTALLLMQTAPSEAPAPAAPPGLAVIARDTGLSADGAAAYAKAIDAGAKAAADARAADRRQGTVPLRQFMEAISGATVNVTAAATISRNGALAEARHKRIVALFQALSPEDRRKLAAYIAQRPTRLAAF